jgi:hypothetical protein
MQYVLLGGAALVGLLFLYQYFRKARARQIARGFRWLAGGALALLSVFLVARGQIGIATLTGPVAFMILRYGRVGSFSFESATVSDDNESTVKSRFISMRLDHDTGATEGRVVAGAFKGRDLMSLDEIETRRLLDEISGDTDSLALLETWLDKNRDGWRDHFGGHASGQADADDSSSGGDPEAEALDILGLKPGATDEEIRAAHRKLIMGVHPDQGGSAYLAARINAAKDRLLRKGRR